MWTCLLVDVHATRLNELKRMQTYALPAGLRHPISQCEIKTFFSKIVHGIRAAGKYEEKNSALTGISKREVEFWIVISQWWLGLYFKNENVAHVFMCLTVLIVFPTVLRITPRRFNLLAPYLQQIKGCA